MLSPDPTSKRFPSKPPRLDSVFAKYEWPLWFITFNTFGRRHLLACQSVHEAFLAYAKRGCDLGTVEVGRYVLMPDHVHLFVRGGASLDLGMWIRGLKRAMSKTISTDSEVWQPGFFDHLLRNDESYEQKWEYVRLNPVRKGLVNTTDEWPYAGEVVRIDRP
ncbi:MAG: transposase [Burkholderiales bacterium]|nr:transposase [Phycisphaerae bacterium]